jgi:T-complex protein 1 subunit gamma
LIAGEILIQSLSQLECNIHPVIIISAYNEALQTTLEIISWISVPIDMSDDVQMLMLIKSSIGTKFVIHWSDLMCRLVLDAICTVSADNVGMCTVNIKWYACMEKVPRGEIEDSYVLSGILLNKDIMHPQMHQRIHKPCIVFLGCLLECKKGESQTNFELEELNKAYIGRPYVLEGHLQWTRRAEAWEEDAMIKYTIPKPTRLVWLTLT